MKFNDGDETELNENLISDAIYAQCEPDEDQYVLLDCIVDHRGLDAAIEPAEFCFHHPRRSLVTILRPSRLTIGTEHVLEMARPC